MNEIEKQATVPYFVHEGQMARMERIIRMLAALLVACVALFVVNNVIWMRYTSKQVELARGQGVSDAGGVHEQPNPGAN